MTKYVDVDPLLYKLPEDLPYKGAVRRVLIMAPAADVRPVVRGKWKDTYNSGYRPGEGAVCGNCDCWNNRRSDFCPNCGADMREDKP